MESTSKYGVYVFKCMGYYHILECLQDVKDWWSMPGYIFRAQRERPNFQEQVSIRHKRSYKTGEPVQLFPDDISPDDIYIMAYDAFIKDLGHGIYLTIKCGGNPHKQRVFYHKKGGKGYETI